MLEKKYLKTKPVVDVTFTFDANGAEEVALVSSANSWKPVAMKKSKGVFTAKVRFPKDGEYQFRYLINGQSWANDEAADAYAPNSFGSNDSVLNTFEI